MQNKRRPNNQNQNRNSSYYKSQVKRNNRRGNFYDNSKRRQRQSYFRAVTILLLFMIVVSGLIFLGIFLKNLVANDNKNNFILEQGNTQDTDNPNIDDDIYTAETAVDIPQIYYNYNGVYLDIQKLKNTEDLEAFIANIREKGINAVNIDIKYETGVIPFEIENPMAILVGAVNANENLPIAEIIDTLHENNLYVSGTISCFKDNLASEVFPSYSLRKSSDGLLWNDAGGGYWLNVYSEGAREYIKEIIAESLKLNFDEIILSQFFFPNLANPHDLQYGDESSNKNKYDAIKEFITDIGDIIRESSPDTKLGVNIPLRYFVRVPDEITGINPNSLLETDAFDFIMTSFAPSEIPSSVSIGGSVMTNAAQNPYNSVKTLCEHFEDYISRITFRPILQAYNSPDGIIYDAHNITAQKQALFENDIKVWILVNFDNLY